MEKKFNYTGKNITFVAVPTTIPSDGKTLSGHSILVDKTGENRRYNFPVESIWLQDQGDEFQNIDNFVQGLTYLDTKPCPQRNKILGILDGMIKDSNKGGEKYSQLLAFVCEIGIWKNPRLRRSDLYSSDFIKYVKNVMWNYYLD